eukprot:8700887-Pyramimonas_sp.AAC.1
MPMCVQLQVTAKRAMTVLHDAATISFRPRPIAHVRKIKGGGSVSGAAGHTSNRDGRSDARAH